MNWKIWSLTLFGILMGFLSVFGYAKNLEWLFWLIIALISAFVLAKVVVTKLFTKSVVVGLFDGIFAGIIQAVMLNTYLAHNPESLDGFKQITNMLEPQYVILFSSPFIGIVYGLFIGLLAFLFDKLSGKKNVT